MFVKALQVQLPNGQVFSDEHIFMLEEKFSHTEKDLEFDLSDNSILLYDTSLIGQENISFSHYMKEGKILKSFLIEIGLATEENYKGYFSLIEKKLEEYLDDGYIQDDAKQNNFNVGKNNLKQNNINQISNQILDKNPEIEEKILLPSELDALIAKVDKNDPKLLEVMGKLEGLRRRKDKG